MSYIIQRQNRFYVVAYGTDPLTGKERRRWHPAGHDRADAEAMVRRLDQERDADPPPKTGGPLTVGDFLTEQWMPRKRRQVRATTAYRYAWLRRRPLHRPGHRRHRAAATAVRSWWRGQDLNLRPSGYETPRPFSLMAGGIGKCR